MKFRQFVVLLGAVVLAGFGIVPTAQATTPSLRINDSYRYEYETMCYATCGTFTKTHEFLFDLYPRKSFSVTVNWEIVDVTTTAGADYTGPTSGTLTLAPNTSQAHLNVPVVNDGVAESTETFRVRATGISVSADISDYGTGTIFDGGNIPPDCSLARINYSTATYAMTCTNRPSGQRWVQRLVCMYEFAMFLEIDGNVVTGNGTSTGSCGYYLHETSKHVILS